MLNSKAYTEVFFIINEMSDDMKSKIPEEIIKNIKDRMDKNYEFYVDIENIEDVELLEDTEKILSVLYTDYFSTEEEREIILNKEKILVQRKNQKAISNLQIKEIFPKENKESFYEVNNNSSNLITQPKEKWYEKILKFIKNLLK